MKNPRCRQARAFRPISALRNLPVAVQPRFRVLISSETQAPGSARVLHRTARWWLALLLAVLPTLAAGQDANECDQPGEAPDIIVSDLHQVERFGTESGITGFSVGSTSCNPGTCWAKWDGDTNEHPVIGQNMFRLQDGRFE